MNTKREITPHKGGRTDRLYVRIKPDVKELLIKMAEANGESVADLIERLAKLVAMKA